MGPPASAGTPAIPERIGVLGGTFDPPHAGHLDAAVRCRDGLGLDRLLLVVANDPWQKAPRRGVTAARERLAMVEAAASGIDRVCCSSLEIERGGPSYTVDTVEAVRRAAVAGGRPIPRIFVVVGADLVSTLPTWERVDDLRRLATLAVVSRPGSADPPPPAGWDVEQVQGGGVEVSSSEVRDLLAAGRSVDGLVPEAVIRCIARRGLYAVAG